MRKYLLRAGKWILGFVGFIASALAIWRYLAPSRIEWIALIGFIGLALLAIAQLFQISDLPGKIAESLESSNPGKRKTTGRKTTGGGTIGGATIGGIIGTMIAPGIGTIIGAVLGALAGNGIEEQKKKKP